MDTENKEDFAEQVKKILEESEAKNPRKLFAWMCEDGEWKPIEQTRMFHEAMKKEAQKYLKDNG